AEPSVGGVRHQLGERYGYGAVYSRGPDMDVRHVRVGGEAAEVDREGDGAAIDRVVGRASPARVDGCSYFVRRLHRRREVRSGAGRPASGETERQSDHSDPDHEVLRSWCVLLPDTVRPEGGHRVPARSGRFQRIRVRTTGTTSGEAGCSFFA